MLRLVGQSGSRRIVSYVSAGLCLFLIGGQAVGQAPPPVCDIKKDIQGWRISANFPTSALLFFPPNLSSPPERDERGDRASLTIESSGKVDGALKIYVTRAQGSLPKVPAQGATTATFDSHSSQKFTLTGTFNFRAISAWPAKGMPAADGLDWTFPLGTHEAAFFDFLTKADQQAKDVQASLPAGEQFAVTYVFKSSGFQQARKEAIGAMKDVAAQLRAKTCREFRFF